MRHSAQKRSTNSRKTHLPNCMDVKEYCFDQAHAEWAPVIGAFILEFATIEEFIHRAMIAHLKSNVVQVSEIKNDLTSRINVFERILSSVSTLNQQQEDLTKAIAEVKRLSKTRNLIAHNGLALMFNETKDGRIEAVGTVLSDLRNDEAYIDLPTLRKRLKEAVACREVLSRSMERFYQIPTHIIEQRE
jgi:hypothetical protein